MGPKEAERGLREAAQLVFQMTEFYQHKPEALHALQDVRRAILERAGRDPEEQGAAAPLDAPDAQELIGILKDRVGRLRKLLAAVYALRMEGCTRATCEAIDAACGFGLELASMHATHGSTDVMREVFARVLSEIDWPIRGGRAARLGGKGG